MKQYVVDQLRESDFEGIQKLLDASAERSVLGGVYSVEIPKELYTPVQLDHSDCHPYYFAVNLTLRQVAFELLIRSRERMRCSCIGYATPEQRDFIIGYADSMLERLDIKI